MPYLRAIRYRLLKWGRFVLRLNDSPRQIAGGVAIGVFAACHPTVISQGFLAIVLATLLRCSRIPAFAMTFISNPVTALPIYGTGYAIGAWICHLFGFRTAAWKDVRLLFGKPEETGFGPVVREKLIEIGHISWKGIVPMEIGATVLGIVLAAVAYYFALRFILGYRLLKAQRMTERARRRLERVRLRQQLERAGAVGDRPDE